MNPQDHDILDVAYAEGAADANPHDGRGVLARAITAATRYRALAPDVFDCRGPRTQDLGRRAVAEAYIAGAMGVAVDHVTITDDPIHRYGWD